MAIDPNMPLVERLQIQLDELYTSQITNKVLEQIRALEERILSLKEE